MGCRNGYTAGFSRRPTIKHLLSSLGCLILAGTCPAQKLVWTQIKPASSPTARYFHAMAYDSARQRVVLFGGEAGLPQRLNRPPLFLFLADTYEWDGRDWTQLRSTTWPPARSGHAMAYDSGRQRTVLFGGATMSGLLPDIWELDGKNWTQMKPTTSPPIRAYHAMAYDSARQRTLLFGGLSTMSGLLATATIT